VRETQQCVRNSCSVLIDTRPCQQVPCSFFDALAKKSEKGAHHPLLAARAAGNKDLHMRAFKKPYKSHYGRTTHASDDATIHGGVCRHARMYSGSIWQQITHMHT